MATAAQIAANRRNALRSTGPRTPEGKEASKMNALKYGTDAKTAVLPFEDAAYYEEFRQTILAELQPQTAMEQIVCQEVIDNAWALQRIRVATSANFGYTYTRDRRYIPEDMDASDPMVRLGYTMSSHTTQRGMDRISRMQTRLQHAYFRALGYYKKLKLVHSQEYSPQPIPSE